MEPEKISTNLFKPREAAPKLHLSLGSVDQLIKDKRIKVIWRGRFRYISEEEIERLAQTDLKHIWPPKTKDGRTTRRFAPTRRKRGRPRKKIEAKAS